METDNLYHTPKKGMTIFKAFLIAFGCIGMVHVIGFFFHTGWLYSFFKASMIGATKVQNKANTYSYFISYTIFILIGLKVNRWELGYFSSTKFLDYLKLALFGFVWYILELGFLNLIVEEQTVGVTIVRDLPIRPDTKFMLRYLAHYQYFFLYIAILGHGLLKNYGFRKVAVALMVFTMPFLNPANVLMFATYNVILIYIYQQTRAFQLILFIMTSKFILEISLLLKFGTQSVFFQNVIRDVVVGNSALYYFIMVVFLVIFLLILFSYRNSANVNKWSQEAIESKSL